MNKEIWKAIPGFEGLYEVSDLGRVRSLDREVIYKDGRVRIYKGEILKQYINTHERLKVNLSKDNKAYTKHPHSLVALAFIGERPENYHVCHIDGDLTNNKLTNIRFDTASQNAIDIYRYGKKSGTGKLSIEQVLEIRQLYTTGKYSQRELAQEFNVSRVNINYIVTRKSFTWLNDDGTIDESHTAVS
ncbi:HNH endonuclease [Mammaliicoccus vitulinus]|uniref:NUMOD4 motif-containing HNH endonuclease n=1 Tax=Mammaliicoccus vitulinus TaxID=71237 RepID=UPI0019501557|nr:NUMOD4 motif-containing HNH endonuclease [Mammaliicoccus vitulinus]MBM6630318.1 HNH endonuclease [Mammaliicoccus vitulinus]